MTKILVPIDFSDTTQGVLDSARHLAKALSGHLILLHVVEPVAQFVGGEAAFDVIQTPVPEDTTRPKHELEDLASKIRHKDFELSTILSMGLAVDEILSEAEKNKVDYIVLGSHGHGALYHLFAGSVVTGVLKSSTCPVIVVPTKK